MCVYVGGGRVDWALCALGPGPGRHLPTGPLEEAELQAFPDAGVGPEVPDTVRDGQVRAGMSVRVRAWGGGRGCLGHGAVSGNGLLCP